jgi:(2R)-3-sulfolactate dehydrogenase (NADP+)
MNNNTEGLSTSKIRVSLQDLRKSIISLLVYYNLPKEQAKIVADCFLEADACGVSTHGSSILPSHLGKLKSGSYNIKPNFNIIRDGGAFAVIDADNAIGAVSGVHCMNYAMERCKQTGIFTVLSRNSNTYGPGFYYPLLAAQNGLIGIALSNSPAAMPAWDGVEKLFGTNPFSIAIPCNESSPIIFDMATSNVAKSRINEARIKNEKIPLGWALDEKGIPTTDPLEAIKGSVLPMAGHKGYGLALTIDILAGVLSGAAFLNNVGKFYSEDNKCMNVGHTFIVIDPTQVYGEGFYNLMDDYKETVHKSKSTKGIQVKLPGDNKMSRKVDSIKNGVILDIKTVESLNRCLVEIGLSPFSIEVKK